jgi:hypothetical protein
MFKLLQNEPIMLIPSTHSMNLLGRSPDSYYSTNLPIGQLQTVVEALSVAVLTVAGTVKALHLFPFSSSHMEEPKSQNKIKALIIIIKRLLKKM